MRRPTPTEETRHADPQRPRRAKPVTVDAECPYCGEPLTISVDESGGRRQAYVEDCAVCCRAIEVLVTMVDGEPEMTLRRQDD